MKLENAFVVLTGASGGIGLCLAQQLITRYHCRVLGIARGAEKLQRAAEQLGENFTPFVGDVGRKETWESLFAALQGQRVDLLIHCAGVMPPFQRADTQPSALTESVLQTNFLSGVYAIETLLPLLSEGGGIVEIASAAAVTHLAGTSAYAASKAASLAYFNALREESRGKRQVTVICPGFVKTDLFRDHHGLDASRRLLDLIAASPEKTAKRILRKVRQGRGFAVMGFDGHLMSLLSRLCPTAALRLCRRVMQVSHLPLFADIFAE